MSDVEDNDRAQSPVADDDDNMSDRDSDQLSDVDVGDLEEYDPLKANIETRPVEIDEDVAKSLKATKRKRAEGETASKKPKEGRRQKKRRTEGDDEVSAADGTIIEGKRRRGGGGGEEGGAKKPSKPTALPIPEEEVEIPLTASQKRARALERVMDAAVKGNKAKRRTKKDEVDLEEEIDEAIAELKVKMEAACEMDNDALTNGQPALEKVRILPEVMALLNRQNIQHAILDPETNFLQAVKFFLEPLSADGSLPAYNIQREIFTVLTRLPCEKEALLSSGIGKVVLFYTKTKRAQPEIKRMAERLMGEWSRPILKRTDDYKKRYIDRREVDINQMKNRANSTAALASSQSALAHRPSATPGSTVSSVSQKLAERRAKALEPVRTNPNRARPVGLPQSYTIAPVSNMDNTQPGDHRPVGANGMEAFRKMIQKSKKKN